MKFKPKSELLSFEEMLRIVKLLSSEGINKIRITGGEPFLRKDMLLFFKALSKIPTLQKISLTTNGSLFSKYIDELIGLGINNINLSIDSLDAKRFKSITRSDYYDEVMACMHQLLEAKAKLKINCVVMANHNVEDILPMVELTKSHALSVRFIEEMPFNGNQGYYNKLEWDYLKILEHISKEYNDIDKLIDAPNSTSVNYQVKGFKGSFGIIPAYTRSFCGSCNRIRITPMGNFKTCLYDQGVFNVRDLMRNGASDLELMTAIKEAIGHKAKDGFEAEQKRSESGISESMSIIGG